VRQCGLSFNVLLLSTATAIDAGKQKKAVAQPGRDAFMIHDKYSVNPVFIPGKSEVSNIIVQGQSSNDRIYLQARIYPT